ncbi:MAG: phosphatase PAP2 family protein [Bdellovibrionota bacterium]
MVKLKTLANPRRRWPTVVMVTAWILVAYGIPNKVSLFQPTPVPLISLDNLIGFSPGWVWAYISYYLLLVLPYFVTDDEDVLNQMIYSFSTAAGMSALFFLFFPTNLPRELYPTAAAGDFMSVLALDVIRLIDSSVNCFPSMHVTLTTIAAMTLMRASRRWAWIAIPWSLAIFYSTVATKQHYALDVIGGIFFGLGFFFFFVSCVYVDDGSSQLAHAIGKKNQP